MGAWLWVFGKPKALFHPTRPKPTIGQLLAVITVLEYFESQAIQLVVVMDS